MRHTNMTQSKLSNALKVYLNVDIHPSRLSDYPHQHLWRHAHNACLRYRFSIEPKVDHCGWANDRAWCGCSTKSYKRSMHWKEEFGFQSCLIPMTCHDGRVLHCTASCIQVELIEVANSQDILENPYHPPQGLGSSSLHGRQKTKYEIRAARWTC